MSILDGWHRQFENEVFPHNSSIFTVIHRIFIQQVKKRYAATAPAAMHSVLRLLLFPFMR